jgi:hypothetical protein
MVAPPPFSGGFRMLQTSADWLQAQADRSLGKPAGLDIAATCLLALAVLSTICVILFDRLTEPNHKLVLERAAINQWDDEKLLKELREAAQTAVYVNEGVLVLVRWTLAVQLVLSTVTGALAAISLLGG